MKIYLGADHGGFEMKSQLTEWLKEQGYEVEDVGADTLDPDDDYPEFALAVAQKVATTPGDNARGVLLCRSGIGVVIAANKVKGVRATTVFDQKSAERARQHNDVNVIGIAGDWLKPEDLQTVVQTFLTTPASTEERHIRRRQQITSYESAA